MDENRDTNTPTVDVADDQELTTPTQASEVDQNAQSMIQMPAPKEKRRFKHRKLILILFATAIVFSASSAGATYYFVNRNNEQANSETTNETELTRKLEKLEAKTVTEQVGALASSYIWLETPKQIDKLAMFRNSEATNAEDYEAQYASRLEYYLIGTGSDGSEVYVIAGPEEMGGRPYLVAIKNGSGLIILKENSQAFFYATIENGPREYHGPELLPGVTVDPSSSIPDMKAPEEVSFKGQRFSTKYPNSESEAYLVFREKLPSASEYQTYQDAGKITEGTIYENISKDDPTYRVSRYELRLKPPFYLTMYLKGELSDQEIDPIIWNDGSNNTLNYASAGRGCGSGNSNEIAKYGKDQLIQIGKSTKGQVIYGFKDNSNALLLKHHTEYIDDSKNIDEWISGDDSYYKKANFGLPIGEYVALRPLYIVEDGMGRMLVFSRQDLVLVGGCAKPVVYAYPTSPTLIDVSVGANVTVSDPIYEEYGWSNVLAMPNGLLGYNGKQYDSLFWEGYGYGEYPEITSGTVISRGEVENTMENQLAQLGLNTKESDDFMEFWVSKIPNTAFVRLSWLGTNDMERLAPLYISPAPDTKIRVFLDMEGLDSYRSMPKQMLYSSPRVGFTVVEWGGLVTDGSIPLLR